MLTPGTKPPHGTRRQRVIERNCTAVGNLTFGLRGSKLAVEFSEGLIHLPRTIGRLVRRPFILMAFHKRARRQTALKAAS
jgi:hypothetical protein